MYIRLHVTIICVTTQEEESVLEEQNDPKQ